MITREITLSHKGKRMKKVMIKFPYDSSMVRFVRDNIPGRSWNPKAKAWVCPFASLPKVIDLLEPKGFLISDESKALRGAAEAKVKKQAERYEHEKQAKELLARKVAEGNELAFVPASDRKLTIALKDCGAYEVVRDSDYYGMKTVGLIVTELDLLAALSDLGKNIDIKSRLYDVLSYTWKINAEAKVKESGEYNYMKKNVLLGELCRLASQQNDYLWGWKKDPNPPANGAEWVLYFEREGRQCSFHAFKRGKGPNFEGGWNGKRSKEFPFKIFSAQSNFPVSPGLYSPVAFGLE